MWRICAGILAAYVLAPAVVLCAKLLFTGALWLLAGAPEPPARPIRTPTCAEDPYGLFNPACEPRRYDSPERVQRALEEPRP